MKRRSFLGAILAPLAAAVVPARKLFGYPILDGELWFIPEGYDINVLRPNPVLDDRLMWDGPEIVSWSVLPPGDYPTRRALDLKLREVLRERGRLEFDWNDSDRLDFDDPDKITSR